MKFLKTLLLLIIFCASSLAGFGQEEISKKHFSKLYPTIRSIGFEYQSFLNSEKLDKDYSKILNYIEFLKKRIDISGSSISDFEISVSIISVKPDGIPRTIFKKNNDYEIGENYLITGRVKLIHLFSLIELDEIISIQSSPLVKNQLSLGVNLTKIDQVWDGYNEIAELQASNNGTDICGEKNIDGKNVSPANISIATNKVNIKTTE